MQLKYIVLLLLSIFIMAGYTYSLDIPQAIQTPLRATPYNFTTDQFNLIYFSTFFLVVFLVIPIGIIIDRYPIQYTLLTLLLLGLAAQTLIGFFLSQRITGYIGLILIMRSILGITGQGLIAIQGYVISIWGKREFELLMGISFSIPYLFDSLSSILTTDLYEETSQIPLTLYIGGIFFLISLLAGFLLIRYIKSENQQIQNNEEMVEQVENELEEEGDRETVQKGFFDEIKSFSKNFWILIAAIFFTECTLAPFFDNLNDLIVKSYGLQYTTTGRLMLIPYTGLTILSIIIGKILKHKPQVRRIFSVLSSLLYLLCFLFLYIVPNTGDPTFTHYLAIIMFLCAMSFSFTIYYTCLTSSIPYLVNKDNLGTAWGICGSAGAIAQSVVPLINTFIMDSNSFIDQSYTKLTYFTMLASIVPLVFSAYIKLSSKFDVLDLRYCDEVIQKGE